MEHIHYLCIQIEFAKSCVLETKVNSQPMHKFKNMS